MKKNSALQALAAIVGLVLLVISYIYFTHQAQNLPAFFPGHTAGLTKIHTTHGIAALVLGLACLAYAWFQSGPKKG
jgi:hypothetical protein